MENTTIDRTENNPQPDWSLLMFWEDITYAIMRLFELIRSLF